MTDSDPPQPTRRSLIAVLGSASVAAVAGCIDDDSADDEQADDGEAGDTEPSDEGDDGEATADDDQYQYFPGTTVSRPQYLTDGSRSGYVPETEGALTEFSVATSANEPRDLLTESYHVHDETIITAAISDVGRFDDEGDKQWDRSTDIEAGPVVTDEYVYVITENEQLDTLDIESGEQETLEPLPLDDDVNEVDEVIYDDGTFYLLVNVGHQEHAVVAYDPHEDTVEWEHDDEYGHTMMALGEEIVAVSEGRTQAGAVRAYDRDSGDEVWIDEELESTPEAIAVQDGVVYGLNAQTGVSGAHHHYAFDVESGDRIWEETGDPISAEQFLVDSERYYHPVDNGYAAFDARTGDQEWTFQMTDQPEPGPVVTDQAIYLAEGNRLHVIDPESGDELAEHEVEETVRISNITLHADRLWFEGSDGVDQVLYSLDSGEDDA